MGVGGGGGGGGGRGCPRDCFSRVVFENKFVSKAFYVYFISYVCSFEISKIITDHLCSLKNAGFLAEAHMLLKLHCK